MKKKNDIARDGNNNNLIFMNTRLIANTGPIATHSTHVFLSGELACHLSGNRPKPQRLLDHALDVAIHIHVIQDGMVNDTLEIAIRIHIIQG